MTDTGPDPDGRTFDSDLAQFTNAVDVDEMRRPRHAEGHGRHQALPAGEDAAIVGAELGQQGDDIIDGLRNVIAKGGRFHDVAQTDPNSSCPPSRSAARRFVHLLLQSGREDLHTSNCP